MNRRILDEHDGLWRSTREKKGRQNHGDKCRRHLLSGRDHVRIKRTREIRRINATAGGVVYVLMNDTIESELFASYVDKDAYYIELIATEDNTQC